MATQTYIDEHKDNDHIISFILADRIQQARYKNSTHKVCDDLNIPFISHSHGSPSPCMFGEVAPVLQVELYGAEQAPDAYNSLLREVGVDVIL